MQRYLVVQRCKHFGDWPSDWTYQSTTCQATYDAEGVARKVHLAVGAKTYPRTSPDETAAHFGFGLVMPDRSHGFWIGDICLQAVDENIGYANKLRKATSEEIDFFFGIGTDCNIPLNELRTRFCPDLMAVVSMLSVILGDVIVPTQPCQAVHIGDDTHAQEQPLRINIRLRPRHDSAVLKEAFDAIPLMLADLDADGRRRLNVAARRYSKSHYDEDDIDKFCDLWEACEFLTYRQRDGRGKIIRGNPVSRIAYVLATHMSQSKSLVESKIVAPLYRMRKNLVHNAFECDEMTDDVWLLLCVTHGVIRFKMGLPYKKDQRLEERIFA